MKKFKQFTEGKTYKDRPEAKDAKSDGEYASIQTVFGRHSLPPIKTYTSFRTVFGRHSEPTDTVKEDFNHSNEDDYSKPSEHDLPARIAHDSSDRKPKIISKSPKRIHDVRKEHEDMKTHYDKYTDEDHKHIHHYTSSSVEVNEHLYSAGKAGVPQHLHDQSNPNSPKLHDHIARMDEVVHRHKTHKPFNVWTGVHHDHDLHDVAAHQGAHEGKPIKVVHHGFTSTSIHKQIAEDFAKPKTVKETEKVDGKHITQHEHILKIHVPKGHHGAYVAHKSIYPNEREFILPRGTKLHIHHKPTIKTRKDYKPAYKSLSGAFDEPAQHTTTHVHTWHARIVK